jgi:signal transduction histidine kinase
VARRLVLSFLGLTVVVLLLLEIPLGIESADRERDELTLDLERDARALGAFAEDTLEGIGNEDLQAAAEDYEADTGARAVIVDAQGDLRADSSPVEGAADYGSRPEIAAALSGELATGTRRSDDLATDLFYVAVPVASGGEVHGAVRLTYPSTEVDARVRRVWLTLAGVGLVSLLTAGVIAALLARSVTRPLRQLQGSAARLGRGDLGARAPVDEGPPEVRELGHAFNDTAQRLEELVGAQDAFVVDASHQLRTPLTALQLRLENLEADVGPDAADDLAAALDEVARLSRLVDGLLALARAEHAAGVVAADLVPVRTALIERRDVWQPVADERAVTIEVDAPADLRARATPDRVSQVLDNLLANAIDLAPAGSAVQLRAERSDHRVRVHVVDAGPGLPPEEREHAFDRFWQGREGTGSSGLGLAIVRKLVTADGGAIDLEVAPEGGLDVVITFEAERERR